MTETNRSYIVTLEVGDWSRDGHERSEKFSFNTNKPLDEIKAAYRESIQLIGYDVMKYCQDYEDNVLPADFVEVLGNIGYEFENLYEDGTEHTNADEFADLILFLAKHADPSLEYEPIRSQKWTVGGYGLF